jgi:hypothetical protein
MSEIILEKDVKLRHICDKCKKLRQILRCTQKDSSRVNNINEKIDKVGLVRL